MLRRRHWPSCSLHGRRRTIVSSVSAPWRSPALNWTKRNMQRRGKSTTHVHIVALSCHRWRSRRSLSDSQTSATAPPVFHLPDACLTTRLDPRATVRKRAGARRETLGWQSARACSRPLLSIAGSDPHTRPNLLEPATPNPPRQGAPAPWRGPPVRPTATLTRRNGVAERLQVRRGGDAAKLAIHSRAGGGILVSPPRCAPSAFINGGGCAAAVLNQWKRLRRSEYYSSGRND